MSKMAKNPILRVYSPAQRKPSGSSFVQLAKKHITKLGTKEAKMMSADIDAILYGRNRISDR